MAQTGPFIADWSGPMADDDSDYDFDADNVEPARIADEPVDTTRYEQIMAEAPKLYDTKNPPPFTQRWGRNPRGKTKKIVIAAPDGTPPGRYDPLQIGYLIPREWDRKYSYWSLDHNSERHMVKGNSGGGYRGAGATYRRCLGFSRDNGVYEDRVLAYTAPFERKTDHNPEERSNVASRIVLGGFDDAEVKSEISVRDSVRYDHGVLTDMAASEDPAREDLTYSSVLASSDRTEVALNVSTQNEGTYNNASMDPREYQPSKLNPEDRSNIARSSVSSSSDGAEEVTVQDEEIPKDQVSDTVPRGVPEQKYDAILHDQLEDAQSNGSSRPGGAEEDDHSVAIPAHFIEQTPFQARPSSMDSIVNKKRRVNRPHSRGY
ncbi:MAG: hypothetical protein Q9186_003810 [Xanthomendoza sp. 1 TL-2023]